MIESESYVTVEWEQVGATIVGAWNLFVLMAGRRNFMDGLAVKG